VDLNELIHFRYKYIGRLNIDRTRKEKRKNCITMSVINMKYEIADLVNIISVI